MCDWSLNRGMTFFRPELFLHLANGVRLMRGQVIMLTTARIMLMRVLRNVMCWLTYEGQMQKKREKDKNKVE